jgi:regulatory protein
VHELRTYLLGRDIDAAVVEAVLDDLIEMGYLDDARYARLFAQDKRELEQWGAVRIHKALLARGIEPEVLESALVETDHELERAVALLQQRFPDPPRERRDRQRALGVLVRRGYAPELAIDAITAYSRDEI